MTLNPKPLKGEIGPKYSDPLVSALKFGFGLGNSKIFGFWGSGFRVSGLIRVCSGVLGFGFWIFGFVI